MSVIMPLRLPFGTCPLSSATSLSDLGSRVVPAVDRARLPGRTRLLALRSCLLLFCLCTLPGCPQGPRETLKVPVITTANPEAEDEFRQAREALENDELQASQDAFEAFVARHPNDPLVPLAHMALGRIALKLGHPDQARTAFQRVTDHADENLRETALMFDAIARQAMGDDEGALNELRDYVGRTVDPEETALLLRTVASAAERLGRMVEAVEAVDTLIHAAAPEADRQWARTEIERLVPLLTPEDALAAADTLPREGAAWPLVAKRALEEAYRAADMGRVKELAAALERYRVPLDERLRAMTLRAERTDSVDLYAVGAILPLTGRGREVGQAALRGLMLASGAPHKGPESETTPRLVFIDNAGEPEQTAAAVDELVNLHRVAAIIGPLSARNAKVAAERAQTLGVPLLTLSPAANLTDSGEYVFRLLPSPEEEAAALVQAARARGASRFAVIGPENGYGRAMSAAFASAVTAQGARVVYQGLYPAGATSFQDAVTATAKATPDAVFVADGARAVSLVAPALAAAGLWSTAPGTAAPNRGRAIALLAPQVAFDERTLLPSERYLQGLVISVAFDPPTAQGVGRTFVEGYVDRFGETPSAFAAQAFDAFRLVVESVSAGARSRDEVGAVLTTIPNMETAGPSEGFSSQRTPRRAARLMQLTGRLFTPIVVTPASTVADVNAKH